MRTHPMHHLKSRGGSLTSQKGTPEDHLQEEEEEDHRHAPHDHPQEVVEVVEVVEAVEEVAGAEAEAAEEHFHCQDTHLPTQLKSF